MKKREFFVGILSIFAVLLMIFYYQSARVVKPADKPVVEELEEYELKGYREPEETVSYLMANIEAGELERALRACAVNEVSGYFNLTSYLNYTENSRWLELIPPSDSDDNAYYEIAKLRLAEEYSSMLQQCIDALSKNHVLEIYGIVNAEPEDPDGKYFERLDSISTILGARDVCEYIVYMNVDGIPKEFQLSLVKYGSYWRVLLFTPMNQYLKKEPCIKKSGESFASDEPLDLSRYMEDQLPMNYFLLNSRREDDIDRLISDWFIYLQRGDLLSAFTYYDFGYEGNSPQFSVELLQKEKEFAVQLQDFYYQMFLDEADFAWAGRHYYDTPGYLPDLLKTTNMQYVDLVSKEIIEEGDQRTYRLGYTYGGKDFYSDLTLVNKDGWKISRLNVVK